MDEDIFNSKIKDGDIRAFELIFKLHYVKLSLFANRFINDIPASEEIVSDTFTCLWEKRDTIIFTTSTSSYLYKMVQNRSLNYIKHKKIKNAYMSYLIKNDLIEEIPKYDVNPYLEKELAEQIRIAIESLPLRCQKIFTMSRYQNLKNKEIAQKLDLSPKTVERQITIALKKLRNSLKYLLFLFF